MSFDEVQFPTDLSYGTRGGPGFRTEILQTDSGSENRIARWSNARRKYNVAYAIKDHADVLRVMEFYLARHGPLRGFRFQDPYDHTTNADHRSAPAFTDVTIGTGDGTTKTFQLYKTYTSGPITRVRNITKPVVGSTVVGLDGVVQTSGWTIDTTTGLLTFTTAPLLGVAVTIGCSFDVPVRFGSELDDALQMAYDSYDTSSLDQVPLIELFDATPTNDLFFYGGALEKAISADYQMSIAEGRVQVFNPGATSGLSVKLPNEALLAPGGPIFYIVNEGSVAITVKTFGGTTVVSLAAGSTITMVLSVAADNLTKVWYGV